MTGISPPHRRRWSTWAHLAVFASAFTLPILGFAAVLLWQYATGERTRLEQAALEEARDIAQGVDGELKNLLGAAQILALAPAVRNGRMEEIHRLTQDVRRTLGVITVLRSPDGQQLVSPLQPFGQPLPKVSLPTDQAVLTSKQPQISNLFTGAISRAPLFAVTVPVLRDNGEISYLLNLSLPTEHLQGAIAREKPLANWVVAVVDRAGTIMARNARHEEFVGKPATRDLQENTKGPEGTWNGFTADGRPVLGAYARSKLADWRIAVGVQRTDLAAPLQRSLWLLAALGVGLLALSALLARLFGQRIALPIQALARQATALGRGEAVAPVETTVSEVGNVGKALATASVELRQREAALRESEERLRLAIDAGHMAAWEVDARTDKLVGSPELNQLFGFPAEASPSLDEFRARYYPGERERMLAELQSVLARGERFAEIEIRCVLPDGQQRWLLLRCQIHLAPDGAPSKIIGVLLDITGRKKSEEHQQLLINELNHRVKNTLATVQSIASQTLRTTATTAEARTAFEERLMALSRAHNVLTRENWEGADLREIVMQAVEPYSSAQEERIHLVGPGVRLPPRMALALAMALQELATNAVKYGALSNETGQIRITWSLDRSADPPRLRLQWEESGGPPVQPPTRRGFGSRLIERSLAQDLDGEAKITFAPNGVVCTVVAPIA